MSVAQIFDSMDYGPAPETAGEALAWIDGHQGRFQHFIAGKWQKPRAGRYLESLNPANGKPLARIARGSAADVNAAVRAARRAQTGWAGLSGHQRARYLYALARAVQRQARLLAVLETLDNGKPIRETRDIDIPLVARHFYHHAGWAQLFKTEFAGHQAHGVVGAIIPWNFPLLMLAWKLAPALAAGNTVVLKPADLTSLSALAFAEICQQAGLPAGVVNIVTGDGNTGEHIVKHGDVDKIAFTGSTAIGRRIRELTAGSGKHLTLELGGKSPFIVFEDADLESAVEGVVDGIWFNQGQVCCAGSRLLVQEAIAEPLLAKLRRRMEKLRVGNPLDKGVDMGAIVAPIQLERIQAYVDQGRAEGCKLWQPTWAVPKEGWFYPPTLFTNVAPASVIAQEEIFGPVIAALSFRTTEEAVALANNSRYGLAASVWSENINVALHVAPKLDCGVVWINGTNQFDAACGFGGNKESGFGREGGAEGMAAYVRPTVEKQMRPFAKLKKSKARTPVASDTIDHTAKLYIGGKQARPDSGYSDPVVDADGRIIAEIPKGSRKDIRNAVEAARGAKGWSTASAHNRAQVLYYLGENLDTRAAELAGRLRQLTGVSAAAARKEVTLSVARLFTYAALADKYDGAAHNPPIRGLAIALPEAIGVIGILAPDETPLLSMVSLLGPALAMGNRVVLVPSSAYPLIATDFYQVLETSDVPGGALNIVTGDRLELAQTLAEHKDVDAVWWFAPEPDGSKMVEKAASGNLKRSWCNNGLCRDWFNPDLAEGRHFLSQSVNVKNIWVPYGD